MYYVRSLLSRAAFSGALCIPLIQNFDVNLVTNADVCYRHFSTFLTVCSPVNSFSWSWTVKGRTYCSAFKQSNKKTNPQPHLKCGFWSFPSFVRWFESNQLSTWWMLWSWELCFAGNGWKIRLGTRLQQHQPFGTAFLFCQVWISNLPSGFLVSNRQWVLDLLSEVSQETMVFERALQQAAVLTFAMHVFLLPGRGA